MHDCSGTTALDLILFGAEPQVLHAQHRVLIDGWIEMRVSLRSAVLFKALRHQPPSTARASAPTSSSRPPTTPPPASAAAGEAAVLDKIIWLISRGMTCSRDEGEPTGPAGPRQAGGAGRGGGASRGGRRRRRPGV